MKKMGRILAVSLIVVFAGCQQSQQKQSTEISRKDRLVGNENLNLKNELVQCRSEIENQKGLVGQCRQEKEKVSQQAEETYKLLVEEEEKLREQCRQEKEKIMEEPNDTAKWILDKLPVDLLNENTRLTEENERLAARIAELEEALKQTGRQEQLPAGTQSPPIPSPNEPPVN
jgi:uncharacterized protein YlxW (UPF0749 family)